MSRTVFDLLPLLLIVSSLFFGAFLVALGRLCVSVTYSLYSGKKHKRVLRRRSQVVLRVGRYGLVYLFLLLGFITPLGQRAALRHDLRPIYKVTWSKIYEDGELLGTYETSWEGVRLNFDIPGHLLTVQHLVDNR